MPIFKQYSKLSDRVYKIIGNVYGLGKTRTFDLCIEAGISYTTKASELTQEQIDLLELIVKQYVYLEDALRKKNSKHILDVLILNTYRSSRHRAKLPVRGQRTHSNARTQRRILHT